jgi:hypothetical protein
MIRKHCLFSLPLRIFSSSNYRPMFCRTVVPLAFWSHHSSRTDTSMKGQSTWGFRTPTGLAALPCLAGEAESFRLCSWALP